MITRRTFGASVVAGLASAPLLGRAAFAAVKDDATVRGVKLGAITGAYGPFNATQGQDVIDVVIARSIAAGVGYVELVNTVIEPAMGGPCGQPAVPGGPSPGGPRPPPACGIGGQVPVTWPPGPPGYTEEREKLRQWRLNAPLDRFREVRSKFDRAGLDLYSYVMTIGEDFTDAEIDAVFRQMQALGVDKFCTNQMRLSMGPRTAPYAEKYKIRPAFHTHDHVDDPNEVASPESLEKLLSMSPTFMINLDIGWYFNGGNDPLAFIKKHPTRITHLHIRDQKKGGGAADVGEGDVQVADIIRYVRDSKLPIGLILEQNGRSTTPDRAEGTRQNIEWMKRALLT